MNKPTESILEVWARGHKNLCAIARYAASLLVKIPPENSQIYVLDSACQLLLSIVTLLLYVYPSLAISIELPALTGHGEQHPRILAPEL